MSAAAHDRILAYVNDVCSQIKFREVHQEIKLELNTHLQEIVAEYLAQGVSEDEAVSRAIAQMGRAETVGKQLDKVHKSKPEWSLLALSLFFVSLGLAAMYFIEKQGLIAPTSVSIFTKSLAFAVLGAVIVIGLYLFDYRKIEAYSKHIYLAAILAIALAVISGQTVNGSFYIRLGPVTFDVIRVCPLVFSVALAGLLNNWAWREPKKLLQGLLLCAAPLGFILAGGALTTAVIYALTCLVLAIVSGARLRGSSVLASLMAAMLGLAFINAPYRLQRLTAFINPAKDPQGTGYLNLQLGKLISESGPFGQGFTLQTGLMPELHTDLIFAYLTFTFGWLAAGILAALATLFLTRVLRIATVVKDNYARLLICGFVTVFAVQFLWNILMNLGFAPISGVGLPFISYGGSQLLANAAALGVISSIYRRRYLLKAVNNS